MNVYLIIACLALLITFGWYKRSQLAKNKVARVIADNCTGCQLCVKKCRYKALEIEERENMRSAILKYPEKCTACNDCIIACKFNALELVDRKQTEYQR